MSRVQTIRATLLTGVVPALACFLALGCGGSGTNRVSGKVTFKGQPIPAGTIYFIPDGSKGNTGPTGYAEIKNGEYDTSASTGRGVGSGPMLVQIEGFDPTAAAKSAKDDTSGETPAKPLFPTYETTADLPAEDSTKDFDVPAEAVNKKPEPETPLINP